jgi:hypothetical protein
LLANKRDFPPSWPKRPGDPQLAMGLRASKAHLVTHKTTRAMMETPILPCRRAYAPGSGVSIPANLRDAPEAANTATHHAAGIILAACAYPMLGAIM